MRIYSFYPIRWMGVGAALVALSACGDEPVEKFPEFSNLQIICADSADSSQGSLVTRVEVSVTDPNRDLLSVRGTVNAVIVELVDPDADLVFTWSPPEEALPMSCEGDFVVSLEALDADGDSTEFYEIVSK